MVNACVKRLQCSTARCSKIGKTILCLCCFCCRLTPAHFGNCRLGDLPHVCRVLVPGTEPNTKAWIYLLMKCVASLLGSEWHHACKEILQKGLVCSRSTSVIKRSLCSWALSQAWPGLRWERFFSIRIYHRSVVLFFSGFGEGGWVVHFFGWHESIQQRVLFFQFEFRAWESRVVVVSAVVLVWTCLHANCRHKDLFLFKNRRQTHRSSVFLTSPRSVWFHQL